MNEQARRPVERDPLVVALARYVEALHRRYPDGPEQMRRERLLGAAERMCRDGPKPMPGRQREPRA